LVLKINPFQEESKILEGEDELKKEIYIKENYSVD
jgi:hypothetical protein